MAKHSSAPDDDFITLAQAFWRLRAYRYGVDRPKFSTAKATIRNLHRYVRSVEDIAEEKGPDGEIIIRVSGQIPLRAGLNCVGVDIPLTDCQNGTFSVSRETLKIHDRETGNP